MEIQDGQVIERKTPIGVFIQRKRQELEMNKEIIDDFTRRQETILAELESLSQVQNEQNN
jgi:hypothetical protein